MTPVALSLAPAGPLDPTTLDAGLTAMEALGISFAWPQGWRERVLARADYLAGSDAARAGALHDAIVRGPDAIWLARGGYGCIRTLAAAEGMGLDLFDHDPVSLWAFSDGTALLAAWDRAGWPAWHAPPATQFPRLDALSRARVRAAWHGGHVAPFEGLETLAPGRATGPMAGGNLCVLASLVGTPWEADLRGRIVLLEDTGEYGYKVDRLVTQLALGGGLGEAAAIVLGRFTHVPDTQPALLDRFFERFASTLGIPVARGMPVGHDEDNAPLPFGRGSGLRAVLHAPAGQHARLSFEKL